MHHFLSPDSLSPDWIGREVSLESSEARHASQVCRVRPGERVGLLDGVGGSARAEILLADRRQVLVRILEVDPATRPPVPRILCQALIKHKAMDFVLRKAVEFGFTRILPVRCRHSVAEVDERRGGTKLEGWESTLREAAKQCGNPFFPVVETPATVAEILERESEAGLHLCASLENRAVPWNECREALPLNGPVFGWVGPEGDFSQEEYDALFSAGARPVRLSRWVLRSETAACALLSLLADKG